MYYSCFEHRCLVAKLFLKVKFLCEIRNEEFEIKNEDFRLFGDRL